MAPVSEAREPANEVKFPIDAACARAIGEWAHAHIGPDPNASDETGGYETTSLYFDTENLDVLNQRGSYARSKYRVRRYGGGDGAFLERKLKKSGIVTKRRSVIGIDDLNRLSYAPAERDWNGYWFHRRILARRLRPGCQVSYRRMARVTETQAGPLRPTLLRLTLIGLTMDHELLALRTGDLRFDNGTKNVALSEKQPIWELKFRHAMPALFHQLIEEFRLSPATVSKYRLAAAALGIPETSPD